MAVAAAEANAELEVPRRTGRSVAVSSFIEVVGEPSETPEVASVRSGSTRWSMFSRASNVQATSTGCSGRASFAEVTPERMRAIDEERRAAMDNRRQKQSFKMTSVEDQKEMDQQASRAKSESGGRPLDRLQTWEVAIDRFNAEATEGRSSTDDHEVGTNGSTRDATTVEEDADFSPEISIDADNAVTTKTAPAAIATGPPTAAAPAAQASLAPGPQVAATKSSFIVCPVTTTGTNADAAVEGHSSTGLREPGGASPLPGPAFRLPPKVQPQREQSLTAAVGAFFMCCSR